MDSELGDTCQGRGQDVVEKKLWSILKPHDSWWDDGGGEAGAAARAALLEFYRELKKLRPAREYAPGGVFHTSYLRGLLAVRLALAEGRYRRACNEIITLMATQPLLQGRVYYNLLRVLEEEFGGGREGGSGGFRELFRARRGGAWLPGGRAEFREAMDVAAAFLEEASPDRKLSILDFLLEVVRNDLKYDRLTRILYRGDVESWVWLPFPPACYDEMGNRIELFAGEPRERLVNLADDCVVVVPWDRRRLRLSVETVAAEGFRKAWYFLPLDVCWVFNGRHSVAAGIGLRRGCVRALEYDVSALFSHVHTDGRYWYSRHNGDRLGSLCDFRIGILFELARKKRELVASSSPS